MSEVFFLDMTCAGLGAEIKKSRLSKSRLTFLLIRGLIIFTTKVDKFKEGGAT